ncbi:hypothetical protein L3C95_16515 [Chitinophaga filiformis]|uniref:hypothetical protein n=1 Tax=Chitinophaga filiformis TaxID=104663 RepID=UPI001F2A9C79|nr:hypothetical protein [Chitinophaga filiformis]MCF6404502.1 hypothetical protein [Chitinophaga filiformis]
MSEQNNIEEELDLQFEIGKGFGLQGKKELIEEYKKVINDLWEHLEAKEKEGFDNYTARMNELFASLKTYRTKLEEDVSKIAAGAKTAFATLNELLVGKVGQNPFLEQKAKELYDTWYSKLKTTLENDDSIERDLKEKLSDAGAQLTQLTQHVKSDHQQFLLDLKRSRLKFIRMEEGYRYGQSQNGAVNGIFS